MRKILAISAFLALVFTSQANSQSLTAIAYSMGLGTGDQGDYASAFSGRGFTLDYRRLVQPNLGIGVYGGWNVFYDERLYDTYTVENTSVSGKQYRYVNSVPLMIAADYYLSPGDDLNPFIGLGIGTIYNERSTDMGIFNLTQEAWGFGFTPQVGFIYSMNQHAGISFTAKYNMGLAAGDFDATQS